MTARDALFVCGQYKALSSFLADMFLQKFLGQGSMRLKSRLPAAVFSGKLPLLEAKNRLHVAV